MTADPNIIDGFDFSGGAPVVTVGSSDVASILNLSPYRSAQEVWARLVGLAPRYSVGGGAQSRGHLIESALLLDWEQRHGEALLRSKGVGEVPAYVKDGWKHARPDGLLPAKRKAVEAKTTRAFHAEDVIVRPDGTEQRYLAWGPDGSSQIPMGYKVQIVWQMHVLDVDAVDVPAFATLSEEQREFYLGRDLAVEGAVVAKVEAWMNAYVWRPELTPPPPPDYQIVTAMHRGGGVARDFVEALPDVVAMAERYRALTTRIKAMEGEAERIKAEICKYIGDAYGVDNVCTWAPVKGRETVSIKDLRKKRPDLLRQIDDAGLLNRGAPSRRFRLNDDNTED